MVENYFQSKNLNFREKIFNLDFILLILILLLGIISIFAMYSTERGNFDYYTKNHLFRFSFFFLVFIITSFLLISKFPTYSFKKIVIPRSTTIFLLFGIVLFFGLLLIYSYKVMALSGLIYLSLIPISYLHYNKIKKHKINEINKDENEDLEDIL